MFESRKERIWLDFNFQLRILTHVKVMLGCCKRNDVTRVVCIKSANYGHRSMSGRGFRPRSEARLNMLVAIILGTVSGR